VKERSTKGSDLVLVDPRWFTVQARRADGKTYCGNGNTIRIDYDEIRRSEADADWPSCESPGCKACDGTTDSGRSLSRPARDGSGVHHRRRRQPGLLRHRGERDRAAAARSPTGDAIATAALNASATEGEVEDGSVPVVERPGLRVEAGARRSIDRVAVGAQLRKSVSARLWVLGYRAWAVEITVRNAWAVRGLRNR